MRGILILTGILLTGLLSACSMIDTAFPTETEEYIRKTNPYDETIVKLHNDTCNFEYLMREDFPDYRVDFSQETELKFFSFLKLLKKKGANKFYLMEVLTVNYADPKNVRCSVKYFTCLNRNVRRIKVNTTDSGTGINKFIPTIKKCDGK